MELTNALPDYQNARGRPCYRPEKEPLGFGLLTTKPLHHVPTFPVYSRSGEETVRFIEFWSPLASVESQKQNSSLPLPGTPLTEEQLEQLLKFHRIVFQEVLRLERGAVIEFNFEKAYTQLLVVPVRRDTRLIDWEFLGVVLGSWTSENVCRLLPRRDLSRAPDLPLLPASLTRSKSASTTGSGLKSNRGIRSALKARQLSNRLSMDPLLNQPGVFDFRKSDFVNAVVMPGYRNLDQPQHYYVAEIRYDLNPLSPFPTSSYANFAAYYTAKYDATISTVNQPLLDVDFTVMRLSLIVPRYVNIRGHYLPCSSEARKRDRRENLTHKQILIPELCFRHPFPASVWRKAVCLPSVLYRLHCLLLAEELRRLIAFETNLGRARLPSTVDQNRRVWSSDETGELFEPLRMIFPLEVQRAVQEDVTCDSGPSGPKGRRRRRRGGQPSASTKDVVKRRDQSATSKRSVNQSNFKNSPSPDASPGDTLTTSGDRQQSNGDGDRKYIGKRNVWAEASNDNKTNTTGADESEEGLEEEVENDSDDAKTPDEVSDDEPQIVKLRATSGAVPSTHHDSVSGAGLVASNLDAMLEETKVIEWEDQALVASLNPDSDQLMIIENRQCVDREYLETGSDVESVDSFEATVRFFPSDDDCETDDQALFDSSDTPCEDNSETGNGIVSHPRSRLRAYRPGPANVLQALTMSCSNDFINLERMETIGDSFLKFVVTVHLYLSYPTSHEGKLSHMRSRIVSVIVT
ncbi:unnamed protein product [Echinostoma caproni]|uniref:RNase III domain-containing protein n=1 Tax=Echinostoma caproni TaxID=27848 RepID=A0A183AUP1_9TREM|nr:unnamed protein product [Echinostoma caproni]